jgi:hypothetical protein
MKSALRQGDSAALNVYTVGYVCQFYYRDNSLTAGVSVALLPALVQVFLVIRPSLLATPAPRRMMA